MLHTQRITLTRTPADDPDGERLILDFGGTSPQAKGPINHCGDYSDGVFLKKWLAPILRNLADTPERMAELDVNEGIVPLIEMRFPPPGTLLTPVFPAPTNARTFVILRLLGVLAGVVAKAVDGRMPADQETIRYTGVYGDDLDGRPYLMREVLGGGSGGRYYADGEDTIHVVPDSRNLPTEFTEARFPFRVESLGLAMDSGGAGQFRGGLGYEKHIRMLKDAHFMSIADRSILACWGVKGGLAGQAVRGHHRPRRPERARGRRPRRRRADQGRRGDPDPDDGWRRLGRPARARPAARGPRRGVAQGLARGRARVVRRGAHRLARRRLAGLRRGGDRRRARRPARRRPRRSSTAARATPASRTERRTPTSTWSGCSARGRSVRHQRTPPLRADTRRAPTVGSGGHHADHGRAACTSTTSPVTPSWSTSVGIACWSTSRWTPGAPTGRPLRPNCSSPPWRRASPSSAALPAPARTADRRPAVRVGYEMGTTTSPGCGSRPPGRPARRGAGRPARGAAARGQSLHGAQLARASAAVEISLA